MNLYTRLINKDHPLPPDYVPENLTDIGIPFDAPCGDPKRLLEIRTAHAALMLIQAAQRESLFLPESPDIAPTSASNSYVSDTQILPAPLHTNRYLLLLLILMLHYPAPVSIRADLHWMFPVLLLIMN